jgi:adenosylcobinamide-phosphate synthase
VCAPLLWFVLLGPTGALLYRLALFFETHWGVRDDPEFAGFGEFSRRAFAAINWLPLRLTAAAFAVVGDFEDAVYCWRTQGNRWPDRSSGILLASGAGALGVRLGQPITDEIDAEIAGGIVRDRPDLGLGDAADADFMQSTIGLVWRTLVLGLLLLVLLWVAGWVGH